MRPHWPKRKTKPKPNALERAVDAARRGGRLLATIHQMPPPRDPRASTVGREQYLLTFQQRVDRLSNLLSDATARQQIRVLHRTVADRADQLRDDTVITYLHGDYYPDNLVRLDDGRVYTIDTTLHQVGPVEDDIAMFLVATETLKRRLLGGRFLVNPSPISDVRHAFIAGYAARASFSPGGLLCSEISALVLRWAEVLGVLSGRVPRPVAAAIERARINPFLLAYAHSLRTLLADGSRESILASYRDALAPT